MYNEDITLLNPTLSVNDQNINLPLAELKENTDYLLAFNNGNRHLLPLIFGNLWDYKKDGKRFLSNGGKFDTYKKCQVWSALNEFKVVNDSRIIFDSVGSRMIYTETLGVSDDANPAWLEREIYIPEMLRGQQLIFSIKASGSTAAAVWSTSNAVSEKIGVEIIGANEIIQKFFDVGAVDNFYYYNAGRNAPEMTTIYIPFNVALDTTTVKVKIFRTVNTGFLHIDKVFVGGLTLPYDNFKIQNIDINEFYDFEKGQTKINATSVCGHFVSELPTIYGGSFSISGANKSELVTYEGLIHFMREVLNMNSTIETNVSEITSTSGFEYLNLSQGTIPLVVGQRIYEITHGTVRDGVDPAPSVTLIAPNSISGEISGSTNVFYMFNVFDVKSDSFKVILSDSPTISGYQIHWSINNSFSALDATGYLPTTKSINPETSGYNIVFDYEQVYGG